MKDIKFRYFVRITDRMKTKEEFENLGFETHSKIFTLDEIENDEVDSWLRGLIGGGYGIFELIARDQYTGLMDKNGREIYEGDLVRGSWSDKINSMVVKFQSPSFVMMINEEKWSEFNIVGNQPYVVIGNIYETAEKEQS